MWKCNHCELLNHYKNNNCQACFHSGSNISLLQSIEPQSKPNNVPSSLLDFKSIQLKQHLLFHGFLEISKNENKPMDIIDLCFRFYKVNCELTNPPPSTKKQASEVMKKADTCCGNNEYFMAFELYKLIKNNFKDGNCEWRITGILDEWKEYEQSELYWKDAITALRACSMKLKYMNTYGLSLIAQNKQISPYTFC